MFMTCFFKSQCISKSSNLIWSFANALLPYKTNRVLSNHLCKQLSTTSIMTPVKFQTDDIIKSEEDKRFYRGLELDNGMKIVLVSDPTTDKAAAALDVHIGHMSDPVDLPGLAHFCEHMLFLGTEKYPEENEYSKYLNAHSGHCNACTGCDHTTYYFDVGTDHLEGALDRFAQFFLCPLFTETASEREVNAVHSEHEKNIQNDMWRVMQLEKSTSNPNHDFSKFGTGSRATLDTIPKEKGIDVRKALIDFHDKWYSSNIMGLSVLGKESLDDLQGMVLKLFSNVKNKNVDIPEWLEHPFGAEQLGIKGFVVPIMDIRNLSITFPIPDLHKYYKCCPASFLAHLIAHEGPGSLLSLIKAKGWCNSLIGGPKLGAKGFSFFTVVVDLTEEGMDHVDDIVMNLFQYINMLKNEDPPKWIFEEYRDLCAMQFRFTDKERPDSYVSRLAQSVHMYPLNEILSGPYLRNEWRPDLIPLVMDRLIPENTRIAVIAKKFEGQTDKNEKWYGTQYRLEKIDFSTREKWLNCSINGNLQLPPKNEFMPTSFDLEPREEKPSSIPSLVQDTEMSHVWFKQDDEFLLPKAVLKFEFVSPYAYLDPLHCDMTNLFVQLFKDSLNEYTYAADLAGLSFDLTNTKYGMVLTVLGYNNKQHVLLDKIMERMTTFKVDPKRFEILKELYIRSLKNFQAEQPYQQCLYYSTLLLAERAWTKNELLDAAEEMTVSELEAYIPQLLSKMHLECLIYGNVTKQRALDLVKLVEDRLRSAASTRPLLPRQLVKDRELQLTDGCYFLYEAENSFHRSSCIKIYYQCGLQNTHANVVLELLSHIINEPCFNILRTREQLGYLVFSGVQRSCGVQGLRVLVQSDRHPKYVDGRVEAFLGSMEEHLEKLSEEEFECQRNALITLRLEKPKKLIARATRYWEEISSHQYNFDRDNIEVAHLRTVTKDQLLEFYRDLLGHTAPHRHKLAVYVLSTAPGGAGEITNDVDGDGISPKEVDGLTQSPKLSAQVTEIEDITRFKSSLGLFPLVQPHISFGSRTAKSKL